MRKKQFSATSIFLICLVSLILSGCKILGISSDDVSGSCTYVDTEMDVPVSLVTDIGRNLLYFGATDSPFTYEIETKNNKKIIAVLKDANALKSMYSISSELRLDMQSGRIIIENAPESGSEYSSKNIETRVECVWFDKASYETKLAEASQAFSQNTPSAIAQALSDRASFEARANSPMPPPVNDAPYFTPEINLVLFDVTKHTKLGDRTYPELTITVRTDKIKLTDISINRSNCKLLYVLKNDIGYELPLELNFGDKVKFRGLCDPTEVTLLSDMGSPTFNW